jgi:hypothetical protein
MIGASAAPLSCITLEAALGVIVSPEDAHCETQHNDCPIQFKAAAVDQRKLLGSKLYERFPCFKVRPGDFLSIGRVPTTLLGSNFKFFQLRPSKLLFSTRKKRRGQAASFDHLVGAGQKVGGKAHTKNLRTGSFRAAETHKRTFTREPPTV